MEGDAVVLGSLLRFEDEGIKNLQQILKILSEKFLESTPTYLGVFIDDTTFGKFFAVIFLGYLIVRRAFLEHSKPSSSRKSLPRPSNLQALPWWIGKVLERRSGKINCCF